MANPTVANVVSAVPAVTGGVSHAVTGTALPTDATTALNVAFKGLGFVGDAGLTNSITRTTSPTRAWGGTQVANLQTDYTETFTFTFLETLNPEVVKAVFGSGNVTVTAASSTVGAKLAISRNAKTLAHEEFVFDMLDGVSKRRIVVPDGQISLNGDITYVDSATVSYPVTLTAFPDASGNTSYEYTDDGKTV